MADDLDELRRAAEEASGELRRLAEDLDLLAENLPSRDKARREQLELTASRLRLTASVLIAESQASSRTSTGHAAAIGKKILRSALPLVVAVGAGVGGAAGQAAFNHFTTRQPTAVDCLDRVEIIVQVLQLGPPTLQQRDSINLLAHRLNEGLRALKSAGFEADYPWHSPVISVTGDTSPLTYYVTNLEEMGRLLLKALPPVGNTIEISRGQSKAQLEMLYERLESLLSDVIHLQAEFTGDS